MTPVSNEVSLPRYSTGVNVLKKMAVNSEATPTWG